MSTQLTVIFDNGGGITLQVNNQWGHTYTGYEYAVEDAGRDAMEIMTDGILLDEAHEQDAMFEPTLDELQNNCYKQITFKSRDELINYCADVIESDSWWGKNEHDFADRVIDLYESAPGYDRVSRGC